MRCVAAACYRAQYLAVVVLLDRRPFSITTAPLPSGPHAKEVIARHIATALSEFDVSMLVVEPETLCDVVCAGAPYPVARMSLVEAKATLLGSTGPPTYQRFCDRVLALQPTLARFIDYVGTIDDPKVCATARWRNNILLSCGLALAWIGRAESDLPNPTA